MLNKVRLYELMVKVGIPPHFAEMYVQDNGVLAIAEAVFKEGYTEGMAFMAKDDKEVPVND